MKKLIFLKVGDPNPKNEKLTKHDLNLLQEFARELSIKEFKKQIKSLSINILKESVIDDASLIIEYKDNLEADMYNDLRAISIIETIDSILPIK